jgi:hypothetical protein
VLLKIHSVVQDETLRFLWNFGLPQRKKKKQKERNKRPVETDAPDGNPTGQDFHSGLKRAFAKKRSGFFTVSHRPGRGH